MYYHCTIISLWRRINDSLRGIF
ncbi:hypothetical protein HYQ26_gp189 [Salmonella phage Se-G]|nr:hypothetical protein HYQ26_gp189 [Salmonella phage Se-G]